MAKNPSPDKLTSDNPTSDNPTTDNTVWHQSTVERSRRWQASGNSGATIWLTGLSGSGKSSIGVELERLQLEEGKPAYLLDGDNLRHGLNGDLGFSALERDENVRRIAHVARLMADAGITVIVPVISPYREARNLARRIHSSADLAFYEVFVDTPLAICEARDPKGLYAKARAGEIKSMTGIDDPYEAPLSPEFRVTPADGTPTEIAQQLLTETSV